jgi:undecaprenyl-diphosphatase
MLGATLLYGQLLLFALPLLKARDWRFLCIVSTMTLVLLVGFSRIALGAHFLTDVLSATFFGIVWLILCRVFGRPLHRIRLGSSAVQGAVPATAELPSASVSERQPSAILGIGRQWFSLRRWIGDLWGEATQAQR